MVYVAPVVATSTILVCDLVCQPFKFAYRHQSCLPSPPFLQKSRVLTVRTALRVVSSKLLRIVLQSFSRSSTNKVHRSQSEIYSRLKSTLLLVVKQARISTPTRCRTCYITNHTHVYTRPCSCNSVFFAGNLGLLHNNRPTPSTCSTPFGSLTPTPTHNLWPPRTAGTRCLGSGPHRSPASPATTTSPFRGTLPPEGRGCCAGARPMRSTPPIPSGQ
eukprot:7928315-Pyramimonas_sp.AAC.1